MEKRHRKPAKTTKSEQRKIEVEFDYESMEAKEVFLAGDQYHFIMDGKTIRSPAGMLGTIVNGEAKAYPLDNLPPGKTISDIVGGQNIQISFDPVTRTATATDDNGKTIPAVLVYWFAWQAFYPQTELWKP